MHLKDHFSKFTQLYPLQVKSSAKVAIRMSEWISAFGLPTIVQADNGKEFKGVLKLLLLLHGVKIINGRPRTPRTQGLIEQANETVKEKILAWKLENRLFKWVVGLPAYALAINRTVQRAIKTTPYQMVYGREMRRYEILPVAMRERAQIEEELIEKDPFEVSDAEEQLLLDQARIMDQKHPLFQTAVTALFNLKTASETLPATIWIKISNRGMNCMKKHIRTKLMPTREQ